MFNYDKILADVVLPNMEKFGYESILYRSESTGTWEKKFDPVESRDYWENTETGEKIYEEPTESKIEYNPLTLESSFNKNEIDGNFVITGDKRYYIAPGIVVPKIGDTISDENEYRIYYVNEIKPAKVCLLYEVYGRV